MIPRQLLFLALVLPAACRSQSSDSGRTLEGTPADSAITGTGERLGAAESGVEFEAPRLIPGMLAQLQVVEDSSGRLGEGSMAGYRSAAGTLVDAMLTDINRVGVGDNGDFRALGDSVVKTVGGGAGGVPDTDPEGIQRSAALMRRLIATYQEKMRAARS
ncbi:MAG: hypothetical protein H0T68_07590 [Gemmatimonadales bacterium]|nr:hypothetical protein [Gemmatimonadales bacterium]